MKTQIARKKEKHIAQRKADNNVREKLKNEYLHVRFARKTDNHEEQDGDNIVIEASPIVNLEGRHEGTHQHEEDRAGSQNRTTCFDSQIIILNYHFDYNFMKYLFYGNLKL